MKMRVHCPFIFAKRAVVSIPVQKPGLIREVRGTIASACARWREFVQGQQESVVHHFGYLALGNPPR